MANVQAISDFVDALNTSINALLAIRDEIHATDVLWPSLSAAVKTNIHNQVAADLVAAQALVAALAVP